MTDKQKEAISILNEVLRAKAVDDEEYFKLLDFIIEQPQQQVQYIPYYPWNQPNWETEPHLFRVTCSGDAMVKTADNINK